MNTLLLFITALGLFAQKFIYFLARLPVQLVIFLSLVGGKSTESFRTKCTKLIEDHLTMSGSIF